MSDVRKLPLHRHVYISGLKVPSLQLHRNAIVSVCATDENFEAPKRLYASPSEMEAKSSGLREVDHKLLILWNAPFFSNRKSSLGQYSWFLVTEPMLQLLYT